MKILQVHNYYQIGGGEDTVVATERDLLTQKGNEVISYYRHNHEIESYSTFDKLKLVSQTAWSQKSYDDLLVILQREKPDVCHVHNFLPLVSPSVYMACQKMNVPVVQTLHNYRLICTNGLFLRNGKVCEACLGKSAYGSVLKKCYRDSAVQTFAVARMLERNKKNKTWQNAVDAYICLTDFAREKFLKHGLPGGKLVVKANFIAEPAAVEKKVAEPYFLYVGRLTASKGVGLFKEIAAQLPMPLKLVGEGDLAEELSELDNITWLGKKERTETLRLIRNATALILPSVWYEGMPMTIIEAFALKTVVITSRMGAMQSMVRHQKNGLLFTPASASDLLANMRFVLDEKNQVAAMRNEAYADYQSRYSPESNYLQLIDIYKRVILAKEQ